MINIKAMGDCIKALRQRSNLTQSEFAEILNVSFQAVSNWERGIAPPELENLVKIATYFNVLVDDLLGLYNQEECFLGIDGGGTKTEFAVISGDGHVLKHSKKDGCNPNDIGFSNTKVLIRDIIKECLIEYPLLKNVFCGISGISVGDYSENLYAELKRIFPKLNVCVKNDIFNLFAIDESVNMAIISGTGSAAFVRKGNDYKRLGGWGHLLDRAGSAYDIGRDALRLALREEDTLTDPSPLSKKLCEKWNVSSVWSHLSTIYAEGKSYIAGLAPVVFEAYKKGDKNAIEIIDDNAKALAFLLNTGVEVYGVEPLAIASGGLFNHDSEIMKAHIRKYSNVQLLISEISPIYGACKAAFAMNNQEIPVAFYENFKESYGG